MKKFNYSPNGYNPEEVNAFLDDVIKQVERIIDSNKKKEEEINNLKKQVNNLTSMKATDEIIAKAKKFDELNETLTEAINMARNTGERMRNVAKQERNLILQDARNNADIIVRDALSKSKQIQFQAEMIRRNIVSFKRKMKINLEEQIKLIDDIEIIDIEK